jgi:hypothetical protein
MGGSDAIQATEAGGHADGAACVAAQANVCLLRCHCCL